MNIHARRRNELRKHVWAVETTQQMTQNSISEYLAEHGNARDHGKGSIPYQGEEILVYFVPFFCVEYLITNRDIQGFQFTSYHKVVGEKKWRRWNEDKDKRRKEIKLGAMMPNHRARR